MQKPEKLRAVVPLAISSAAVGLLITIIAARAGQPAIALAAMVCATAAVLGLTLFAAGLTERSQTNRSRRPDYDKG